MDTVILLSGGLDSAVLLYELLARGREITALSFNYGQCHHQELHAAELIANHAGVTHRTASLDGLSWLLARGALTGGDEVPHGSYTDQSMKLTIVPNRNMVLLALATSWAITLGASEVAYAAHGGDHFIYPDCRPQFVEAMRDALANCDDSRPVLQAPFLSLTKADIVARGSALNVPFELTWSCYEGGAEHCGLCGTCTERREAFTLAGVADPTVYRDSPSIKVES